MENTSNNSKGKTKGQIFIEEWIKRRQEDEERFLKEVNDPEHRKKMEALKGKIVRNGKIISAS